MTTSARAAGEALAEQRARLARRDPDTIDAFLVHCRRRNLTDTTRFQYDKVLRRLERQLGRDVLGASVDELNTTLDAWRVGPRTRYQAITVLRSFYRWAIEEAEILTGVNPAMRVPIPRYGRLVPRPMGDDAFQAALEQAPARMRAWLALAAFEGLRVKEIAGLRREDILEEADPPVLIVSAPKGGRQRILPLNPYVIRALRLAGLPASGYLFESTYTGRPVKSTTVSSTIGRYLRHVGVAGSAHQLRHRFATELYRSTLDLRMVQELMGHVSPTTTAQYTAYRPARAGAAVAALGPPQATRGAEPHDEALVAADRLAERRQQARELAAILPRFRQAQTERGYAPSSISQQVQLLTSLELFLMPGRVALDATGEDLARFLVHRLVKPGALANYVSRLRGFYGWARAERLITADPTARLLTLMARNTL